MSYHLWNLALLDGRVHPGVRQVRVLAGEKEPSLGPPQVLIQLSILNEIMMYR